MEETLAFLDRVGIWYSVSRNLPSKSCRDAAQKRNRLGHTGIPLHDEFKSFLGRYLRADGKLQYAAVHSRGDRLLELDAVARTLQAEGPFERVEEDELKLIGAAYGLVNPFRAFTLDPHLIRTPILQLFDADLLTPLGLPGTVMTNAGDYTWAIEFRPEELFRVLPGAQSGHVSAEDPDEPEILRSSSAGRSIGIITGNAPESGMLLWTMVNNFVREYLGDDCLGDISMPPVVLSSLPEMGLSMEIDQRTTEVWRALEQSAKRLLAFGVDFVVLADNTTQVYADQLDDLARRSGSRFVSLPETLHRRLKEAQIDEAAIMGISFVAEPGPFSPYFRAFTDVRLQPVSESGRQRLQDLAYQVKQEGANESGLNKLRDVLRSEVQADTVILALTELSILLARQRKGGRSGKNIIDPLEIYADELARMFLGIGGRTPYLSSVAPAH